MAYLTLAELKQKYFGAWDDSWDSFAEDKLEVASSKIDMYFRRYGYTVTERLASGDLDEVLLKEVVSQVVIGLIAYNVSVGALQASNISENAGPYSISYQLPMQYSRRSVYLRPEELEDLGLETVIFSTMSFFGENND